MIRLDTFLRKAPFLFVGFGLAAVICVLLFHTVSLSSHVEMLEKEKKSLAVEIVAYDRLLCDDTFKVTTGDQVTKHTIESAGYTRTYLVHTPYNYDPHIRYPVVLGLDGIRGSGERIREYSNLDTLPAIVVYPDSLQGGNGFTAWQGAPYSYEGDRDVQFMKDIINILPSQYCADSEKVFAVGMSNGGGFAVIAACQLEGRIRAIAGVSGAYYQQCNKDREAPSFLALHSTADIETPFSGSLDGSLPDIQAWMAKYAKNAGCETEPKTTVSSGITYRNWLECHGDSHVRLVIIDNQYHGWLALPNMLSKGIGDTASYIWRFFQDELNDSKR